MHCTLGVCMHVSAKMHRLLIPVYIVVVYNYCYC